MVDQQARFLRALRREPVDKVPVWIMRQAGRYLPEYREIRANIPDFMTLCKTPELACQVTLQPLERFDLDAAILFSDILTIPDAMGLGLEFAAGEGPRFRNPVQTAREINKLGVPDPTGELNYVLDAVKLIRHELNPSVPLIGFAGSPWTLATYMVEGKSSKTFSVARKLLYSAPELMHKLLAVLTESVTQYLLAQIEAGVQAVMVFDSWGGLLAPTAFSAFSVAYARQITQAIKARHPEVPVIFFSKGAGVHIEEQLSIGSDALGLDWTVDIGWAKKAVAGKVALQGNLDPAALYASPKAIPAAVSAVLDSYGPEPGHIFNLGHGIYPDISPDNLAIAVNAVHDHQWK